MTFTIGREAQAVGLALATRREELKRGSILHYASLNSIEDVYGDQQAVDGGHIVTADDPVYAATKVGSFPAHLARRRRQQSRRSATRSIPSQF